jgi:hypothetical protein
MAFDFHVSFPDGSIAMAYDSAFGSAMKSLRGIRCFFMVIRRLHSHLIKDRVLAAIQDRYDSGNCDAPAKVYVPRGGADSRPPAGP